MYRNCTTEESVWRQQQFEMLLLKKMGTKLYAKITVGELCQEAGISRNAFYQYFENKDDVLYALIDHTLLKYYQSQQIRITSNEAFHQEVLFFLEYWNSQKLLLDALQKNRLEGKLLERCLNHNLQRHLEVVYYPFMATEESRYQVMLFIVNGVYTLILDWHHKGYRQTIPEMAETIERVLLKPPFIL